MYISYSILKGKVVKLTSCAVIMCHARRELFVSKFHNNFSVLSIFK